ncbi:MAG: ribonuclease P protein component [Methylophilaceae bacterium 17-44-8]|jgi:ribonuclease P protein component|nr:MAG: ribonuclease P protein component [Methylophilales bacterium 28-44-11]OZA04736.1 MAG: ribonuclease P protein component [Methylophilaceae bacterium 17-44-8]
MQTLVMLKKTDEFSSVFSFRKRISSHFFVVHYKPNTSQPMRVGFVVAKKVAKQAVERNYMRRVMREVCRHGLTINVAADLVIQVHKKFVHQDFIQVNHELNVIVGKIKQRLNAEYQKNIDIL